MRAEVLIPGSGAGELLRLDAPISFWGGVDPCSGRITQVRHPQAGQSVAGRVLALPGVIGSSSSAAVMLELIHGGNAPAALIVPAPDAILLLGIVVAREMAWTPPPVVRLDATAQGRLPDGHLRISPDGWIGTE